MPKPDSIRIPPIPPFREVSQPLGKHIPALLLAHSPHLTPQHPPNLATLQHLPDPHKNRCQPPLHRDRRPPASLLSERRQLARPRSILRQRPLDQHVLAGRDAGAHRVEVLVDAGRADDEVDVGVSGEVCRGAVGADGGRGKPILCYGGARSLDAGVEEGDDLEAGAAAGREKVGEVGALGPGGGGAGGEAD